MRKREFLRKLNSRLSHLDRQEREDILDYYDELIEDSIDRTGKTEAEVIYDLGELEDIVRRVDPYHRSKMRYDAYEEDKEEEPKKRSKPRRKEQSNGFFKTIWQVILTIVKAILFFAVTFACILIFISGIAAFFGAIYFIIVSVLNFDDGFSVTLFRIGFGIAVMGGTCIAIPLIIKILKWLWKLIRAFFNTLSGKKRRSYAYEN